jgi:hypothetical protein
MRRVVVIFASLTALAVPAAALALASTASDGTLVLRNATGLAKVPVVALDITGTVIGQIDNGKIVIDPGAQAEVTGADSHRNSPVDSSVQIWTGTSSDTTPFKFRAAGGHFRILIYGSGVDLTAVGRGTVTLAGLPDTPNADGKYSLNGGDFHSLPGAPTKLAPIAGSTDTTG